MSRVSVIIVSWNAREYLRGCLSSIRETAADCVREIIVVDNASADGSPDMVKREFPEVILIEPGENLGFARANNLAMQRASGEFLALINSDVVVKPGCIQELVRFLDEHPESGLIGPRIVGGDGRLQGSCRRLPTVWNNLCRTFAIDRMFPRVPFLSGHEMRHFDHERQIEAEVLSGCFWMARKSAVDQVGGLDERFFFYMEDVDWSRRFHEGGWKVHFVPQASAIHFGGASTANAPLRYMIQYHRANLMYWEKYYGFAGKAVYFVIATLHHGVRLVLRAMARLLGRGSSPSSKHKLMEDVVSLRWLFTGVGV